MAAPTILGSACYGSTAWKTSHSVTLPSWSDGDLAVIFFVHTGAAGIPSAPTGWTEASKDTGTGIGGGIFWRIMQSGDTDPPVVTTSDVTPAVAVSLVIDAGTFDAADPIDVVTTTAAWNSGSSTTPTASAVTTNNANSLALAFGALDGNKTPYGVNTAGWTETHASDCGQSNAGAIVADKDIASASSTGAVEFSMNASDTWVCAIIAINAAAGAPGGITSEASPGTLTLAGVAADQVVTTNIDASATPGAVTLAGVAAEVDITSGITYEATAGALQVTGVEADAAITENLNLDATAASLVLTGQAADIVVDVSYTLEATPGALTLTGQTADFAVAAPSTSFEAEATPGALSLTGQAATVDILTALSLEATPGAIVFTGAKATVQGLVSAVVAPKTGGKPSRTIYLGKKRYQVQNRAQEEALVRGYVAELERAQDMATLQDEPVKAKAVKRRIKLARTRLRKLETPDPVESLKRLDDEILTLLGGTPWL